MSTGLLIVLVSLSAIMIAGAILSGVRHFWHVEEEPSEGIARVLAEAESGHEGEPASPEPERPTQESEGTEGSA